MLDLRFLPQARAEMRAAVSFYNEQAPGLGRDLVREIRAATDRLRDWPESGPADDDEFRRATLVRFPFTLIYRVSSGSIYVLALMHQRQRPGYWRDRG